MANANPWELGTWDLLADRYEIVVAATRSTPYDLSALKTPPARVRTTRDRFPKGPSATPPRSRSATGIEIWEDVLRGADIVHSAELGVCGAASPRGLSERSASSSCSPLGDAAAPDTFRRFRGRVDRRDALAETDIYLSATERARRSLLLEGAQGRPDRRRAAWCRRRPLARPEPARSAAHNRVAGTAGLGEGALRRPAGARAPRPASPGRGSSAPARSASSYPLARDLGVADWVTVSAYPYERMPDGPLARASAVALGSLAGAVVGGAVRDGARGGARGRSADRGEPVRRDSRGVRRLRREPLRPGGLGELARPLQEGPSRARRASAPTTRGPRRALLDPGCGRATPLRCTSECSRELWRRGVTLATGTQVVGQGSGARPVSARDEGDHELPRPRGVRPYATALVGASLVFALADLGIPMLLAREVSKYPERTDEIGGNLPRALRLVTCAAMLAATAPVVPFLPYTFEEKVGPLIATAGLLIGSVSLFPVPFFQVNMRLELAAVAEVFARAAALAALGLVVLLDLGFLPVLASIAVAWTANLVLTFFLSRSFWHINVRWNRVRLAELMWAAFPIAVVVILGLLHFRIDALLLTFLQPATDVGIYVLAYSVFEQALFLPALFMGRRVPDSHAGGPRTRRGSAAGRARQVAPVSRRPRRGRLSLVFTLADPLIRLLSNEQFLAGRRAADPVVRDRPALRDDHLREPARVGRRPALRRVCERLRDRRQHRTQPRVHPRVLYKAPPA